MNAHLTRCMHIDMDTFFVSIERLLDPALADRPVIVGGSPFQRGVVAGCSREARVYGVHSAMPLRKAYELCPQAVFLHPNHIYYSLYSDRIAEILTDSVPALEKASVDEFYLDISGCERVFGQEYQWSKKLKRTVEGEVRLPLTYGIARNKTVAKVATTVGKRSGDILIPSGGEKEFLSPNAIRVLPGVGEVMERELHEMNIRLIGDIARLPLRVWTAMYGANGRTLHQRSCGIDNSPIRQYHRQQQLSSEHTFAEDVLDPAEMIGTLRRLAIRVGKDLREKGFLTKTISCKLRYADFVTVSKTLHCDYTNADHSIFAVAERCFRALYTRRVRVRLLGIGTGDLIEDYEQLGLFPYEEDAYDRLYAGLDSLRERFGKHIITSGEVLALKQKERRQWESQAATSPR